MATGTGYTGEPLAPEKFVEADPANIVSPDLHSAANIWLGLSRAGQHLENVGAEVLAREEHLQKAGAIADFENQHADWYTKAFDQYRGDPVGFENAARAHNDGALSETPAPLVPHAKAYLGGKLESNLRSLLNERHSINDANAQDSLKFRLKRADDDVMGLVSAGKHDTGDFQAAVATYNGVLDTQVSAGVLTQDHADYLRDDLTARASGQHAGMQAVGVYKQNGFAAAVDFLQKNVLENDALTLRPSERQKVFSQALSAVRLQKQLDGEDRGNYVEQAKDIEARLQSNNPPAPEEVQDTLAGLRATGAHARANALAAKAAAWQVTAPYRLGGGPSIGAFGTMVQGMRGETQFGGLAPPFVDAIRKSEGFTPVAAPDFKQLSYGYGTKAPAPGATIDKATAETKLNEDLTRAAAIVDRVNPNLPQGVRAALTSLTFNAGADWVNSELGNRIRAGDYEGAKARFLQYNQAGGQVNPALVERRRQEAEWFNAAATPQGDTLGLPGVGRMQREVQNVFVAEARKSWQGAKAMAESGRLPDPTDLQSYLYAANISGDPVWFQEVQQVAATAGIWKNLKDLPADQQQAAINSLHQQAVKDGYSVSNAAVLDRVNQLYQRKQKMLAEDPVALAIERGAAPPDPIDFSSPQAAVNGVGHRVQLARGTASAEGVAPGSAFQDADRQAVAGAIAGGNPQQAGAAFAALGSLPDDVLIPTLRHDSIKNAVLGAARSPDAGRYNAAMSFIDSMYAKAPESTKQLFGEEAIHDLMTWQTNLRYMSPEQVSAERQKRLDPQVRQAHQRAIEEGEKVAHTYKADDIVSQFGVPFVPGVIGRAIGVEPAAPTDALTRDALMGDFANIYARRYAETQDKGIALKQTVELLRTKWQRSEVNGGRLMLNAPETIRDTNGNPTYPAIDGSWSWMTKQIEADLATQLGKAPTEQIEGLAFRPNYSYTLVSDRQTQAEAQAGHPASYRVVIVDADGSPQRVLAERYRWDPREPVNQRRTNFELERARVLELGDVMREAQSAPSAF